MTIFKKYLPHIAIPILAVAIFIVYFQLWNFDLLKPLFNNYQLDVLAHALFAKTIIDNGWFLTNHLIGLPYESFYLYDFPLQGDSLNFAIFKLFSYFTTSPFLVLNLYFITTFFLIAFTSFIALRNFGISIISAAAIAILYDFTFYHFQKGINHALLANYMMVPLVIMVATWIMDNKISVIELNKRHQYCFSPNNFFFIAALIAILVSMSDVYYAFYACVIFVMAHFIDSFKSGRFLSCNFFAVIALCLVSAIILFCLYLPSFKYWLLNGFNAFVGRRHYHESEGFALRVVDLLLPASTHYLEYFAYIREFFKTMVSLDFTIANEREAEALGLVGSFGFLFLLFWMMARSLNQSKVLEKTIQKLSLKNSEVTFISNLSLLNILVVLFATVGGFVMIIVPLFPMIRSHCRFSIFIAFISLTIVGIIFDKILQRKGRYPLFLIIFITFIGLLDQVGNPWNSKFHNQELENKFNIDQKFVTEIEKIMPINSHIFIMPVVGFPEGDDYGNSVFYLQSQNLLYSYPVITGRKSYVWQNKIVKLDFGHFIASIKEAGFNGIIINREKYARDFPKQLEIRSKGGWDKVRSFEKELSKISKSNIYSLDQHFSFFSW